MPKNLLILCIIQILEMSMAERYYTSLDYESVTSESEEFSELTNHRCSAVCLERKCVYYDFESKLMLLFFHFNNN